jgi:hypothetical protein
MYIVSREDLLLFSPDGRDTGGLEPILTDLPTEMETQMSKERKETECLRPNRKEIPE